MSLVDFNDPASFDETARFIERCGQQSTEAALPEEFSESSVRERFSRIIGESHHETL
jgi:hypothetical protein